MGRKKHMSMPSTMKTGYASKHEPLVGKVVEVVPWHKDFSEKGWIIKGKLVEVRKPQDLKSKEEILVLDMKDPYTGEYPTIRVASGHKVRKAR